MYLIQGDALSEKGTGRDRNRNVGMGYDLGMRNLKTDGWMGGWMEGRKGLPLVYLVFRSFSFRSL